MTRFEWWFLSLTILLTVAGQLLVKLGMLQVGSSPEQLSLLPQFVLRALSNRWVILGFVCAAGAAAAWIVAVSRVPLSFAYPFIALTIVLVLALSGVLFDDVAPVHRWIGVAVVCLGLVLASRS
jgi:multidrug transporter EmrE-like cation transporter